MSRTPRPSPGTSTKPRSMSNSTSSYFTDSAINIDTPTPSPKRKRENEPHYKSDSVSSSKSMNSVSNRLTQLAAVAWAAEEDKKLNDRARQDLKSQLDELEAQLEGRRPTEHTSSEVDTSISSASNDEIQPPDTASTPSTAHTTRPAGSSTTDAEQISADLEPFLTHLTTTTDSLRTRFTEAQHLHVLSLTKLEAIAQRCFDQEQAVQQLTRTVQALRRDNDHLNAQNAHLSTQNSAMRGQVQELESQAAQKDVAVSAMTGAVAGLEGWINSASNSPHTPRNNHPHSQKRAVVRGRGRFRGKYFVEDAGMGSDGASDLRHAAEEELQEGIRAWVRGFRDVEEGFMSVGQPGLLHRDKGGGEGNVLFEEDEFGDFETASAL